MKLSQNQLRQIIKEVYDESPPDAGDELYSERQFANELTGLLENEGFNVSSFKTDEEFMSNTGMTVQTPYGKFQITIEESP